VAAGAGYEANGGGVNNALGRLRALELATIEECINRDVQRLGEELQGLDLDSALVALERLNTSTMFSVVNLLEGFGYLKWHDESLLWMPIMKAVRVNPWLRAYVSFRTESRGKSRSSQR
jgi:hypothetical protein